MTRRKTRTAIIDRRLNRKILIVGTMTSPSGAPIAALRLAAGLAAAGWEARAIFLYHREAMNNVDFDYTCLLDHPPRSLGDYARVITRLAQAVRGQHYDVVIGFLPLAMILSALVGRLCGVAVRAVSHRVPTSTYSGAMHRLDLIAAQTGFYTDVIAVSTSVANSCARYPAAMQRRVSVVYNGLKDWQRSPLTKHDARAQFGLDPAAALLVAVGRLDTQKNYPLLIEAMAHTNGTTMLAIAGSGPLETQIRADIAARGLSARVKLLGPLARSDVPALLGAADLFAQPSLFEGQSNALLEALSAGLPCLVSDVPEQAETVTAPGGRVAGAILPLGDAAAWGKAIDTFAERGQSFAAARDVTAVQAQLFTFDRMIAGFIAVFEAALARRD